MYQPEHNNTEERDHTKLVTNQKYRQSNDYCKIQQKDAENNHQGQLNTLLIIHKKNLSITWLFGM